MANLLDMIGRQVRAFSAADHEHTVAVGECVAVAQFPTYVIRTADGTNVHWACHLTEEQPPPTEPDTHAEDLHPLTAEVDQFWTCHRSGHGATTLIPVHLAGPCSESRVAENRLPRYTHP